MATCEYFLELLSAGLDGELTAEEENQLAEHLACCPECRALAPKIAAAHAAFPQMEEIPAPEGFAAGVMARIRAEEKPKVIPLFRRPQFRALAGMAACAVLCVGLFRGMSMSGKDAAESGTATAPAAAGLWERAVDQTAVETATVDNGYYTYTAETPMEIAVTAADALTVTEVQYLSVPWSEELEAPRALLLTHAGELEELLKDGGEVPFGDGPLLAVVLTEPSGSNRHEVVSLTGEQVTVRRVVPEEGDCDMAAWVILIRAEGLERLEKAPEVLLLKG